MSSIPGPVTLTCHEAWSEKKKKIRYVQIGVNAMKEIKDGDIIIENG